MRSCTFGIVIVAAMFSAPAWSQNIVFYDDLESGDTTGWWAPARVGETGQETCFNEAGTVIACAGTGQDGDIRPGVAWPSPRFVDNSNGTVTDMLTGLIWLKDASCTGLPGTMDGFSDWETALTASKALANGTCGLSDGSAAGEWRLPSIKELLSLVDFQYYGPALSNADGTAKWIEGDAFSDVRSVIFWSSTSRVDFPDYAWGMGFNYGFVDYFEKTTSYIVWPVRGGL